MKNLIALCSLALILTGCGTKSQIDDTALNNPIISYIDLTNVKNDKVEVTIDPGRFSTTSVTYRLPKVVQGTYEVSDFGAFVEDFQALDYRGNSLTITKVDANTWNIEDAENLDKIIYYVNDTFDIEGGDLRVPFSPAGTNIEAENFVLNLHGFIGYFDSLKNNKYTLSVKSPSNFKRTSALENVASIVSEDSMVTTTTYNADRYFEITDNPMMYGDLDVETFKVGDITIDLSIYSPNKVHTAKALKETMYTMMKAQKQYLGDINTTDRYDIYLYLADNRQNGPRGFGALEHHKSTVVVLREGSSREELAKSMVDLVSHEFFHIVTPLSVHSEDVHFFDYNTPTFSKHLWMYEGVTEYFAQHFQVYEGLVTPQEYYNTIMQQIDISRRMDDSMSFTVMSENILDEPYASNYYNVYQKGALIGMCIDILMREGSNGERSMLSLMKELSNKYGVDKPFEDDAILEEIANMTYPSVNEFLQTHVVGTTPIDYNEFFNKVGLTITKDKIETNYLRGGDSFIFGADQASGNILFTPNVEENSFWADNGVQAGDILLQVGPTKVNMETAQTILGEIYRWQPGNEVEFTIKRNGVEIPIKTTLVKTYTNSPSLKENKDATAEQVQLRNDWLNLAINK